MKGLNFYRETLILTDILLKKYEGMLHKMENSRPLTKKEEELRECVESISQLHKEARAVLEPLSSPL